MRRRLRTRVCACWSPMDTRHGHSAAGLGPHLRIPLGVNVQVSGRSGFRCVPTSFHRLVKKAARPEYIKVCLRKRNERLNTQDRVGRAESTDHSPHGAWPWGHGAEPESGPAYCKRPYLPPPHQDPHHPHFLPFLPSRTSPEACEGAPHICHALPPHGQPPPHGHPPPLLSLSPLFWRSRRFVLAPCA